MATDKQKTSKKKKSLWKRIKRSVCKATLRSSSDNQPEEKTPFLPKTASAIELAKSQKAQKRKKSLKKLKQYTVAACRYIGIGASLSAHGYGQGGIYTSYPMYPDNSIGARTEFPYYF